MKIKITQLNNKTRKGTYLYIKNPKTRSAYFKLRENTPIDAYKQYYTDKYIKNKPKGKIKEYLDTYEDKTYGRKTKGTKISRQADRYLKRIKTQRPELLQAIRKGIGHVKINNILTATTTDIQKAKEKLLTKLVLDKELLKIITEEENLNKLSNRFEYRIEAKGNKGIEATANKFGNTPTTVIQRLKEQFKQGNEYEYIGQTLEIMNYQNINDSRSKFKLNAITMTIIFRKGK